MAGQSDDIEWRWDALNRQAWTALLARAPLPTLEQCWAYGAGIERVSSYRAPRHRLSGQYAGRMAQLFQRDRPLTIGRSARADGVGPLTTRRWGRYCGRFPRLARPPAAAVVLAARRRSATARCGCLASGRWSKATPARNLTPEEEALRSARRQVAQPKARRTRQDARAIDRDGKMLDWLVAKHGLSAAPEHMRRRAAK
jgi:hypothetical protein